jgi:ankyrin repeat protein
MLHCALACSVAIRSLPRASGVLNCACPRSGMTPLHKAIEKRWSSAISALLDAHADCEVACALYDNDTPIKLAGRFHYQLAVDLLQSHIDAKADAAGDEPREEPHA